METPLVWFNKGLSNAWEVYSQVRQACQPGELRILCTHPRRHYPGRHHADLFEQEPSGLGSEAYLAYCLDIISRYRPSLFVPGRKLLEIARAAPVLARAGTKILLPAGADVLEALANKARTYARLRGLGEIVPDHIVFRTVDELDAGLAWMRERRLPCCYKPAVSVYGLGFHTLPETGAPGGPFAITLAKAREEVARAGGREHLLMPYLPGPERSVDCLAWKGRLLQCVVRRKEEGGQVLEANEELARWVREITGRLGLSYLFNVQFRSRGGKPFLLEINARMSGGMPMTAHSGVVLPLWALRLGLGAAQPEEVPTPATGAWVPQPEPASSI